MKVKKHTNSLQLPPSLLQNILNTITMAESSVLLTQQEKPHPSLSRSFSLLVVHRKWQKAIAQYFGVII
jgi:hypothetical protein